MIKWNKTIKWNKLIKWNWFDNIDLIKWNCTNSCDYGAKFLTFFLFSYEKFKEREAEAKAAFGGRNFGGGGGGGGGRGCFNCGEEGHMSRLVLKYHLFLVVILFSLILSKSLKYWDITLKFNTFSTFVHQLHRFNSFSH